jgi:integrase
VPRKSQIPPYRLHRGSGQAVVHVNGGDVYLGVHGSPESKEKYQDIIRKLRADHAKAEMEHVVRFHVDITVAELAAKYLPYAEGYYVKGGKPTSQIATIKNVVTKVLLAEHSHLEAVRFGPLALKKCRDAFVAHGLARTEVNRRVGLIRGMFKWGVAMELIPATVLVGLQSLPGLRRGRTTAPDRIRIRPIPQTHVDAVLPYLAPTIAAMVMLQELTGMRPDEIVQMRGCDLTMSGSSWEYRPEHHKLEHRDIERVIMIGPKAQSILKQWLRIDTQAYLCSPKESLEATWSEAAACWEERRKGYPGTTGRSETAKAIWGDVRKQRTVPRAIGRRSDDEGAEFQVIATPFRAIGGRSIGHVILPRSIDGVPTDSDTTPQPRSGANSASSTHGRFWDTPTPTQPQSTPSGTWNWRDMRQKGSADDPTTARGKQPAGSHRGPGLFCAPRTRGAGELAGAVQHLNSHRRFSPRGPCRTHVCG